MAKITLDKDLIKKAVKSLKNHYATKNQNSTNLFDTQDDFIYLEINLAKIPEKFSIRPI